MDAVFEHLTFGIGQKNRVRVDHELFDDETWKLDAVRPAAGAAARPLAFAEEPVSEAPAAQGFGYWLRSGLAFSLPLMVWLAVLLLAWMLFDFWV